MDPKITASEISDVLGISLQAVHKRLKINDLNFTKSQNRVYFGHDTAKKLLGITFTPKVICVQIVKGGTGKTSLTHSIAIRASLLGAKVLCIDLDQQGNLTQAFRHNADETPVMIDLIKNNSPIENGIVNLLPGIDIIPSRIENAVLDTQLLLSRSALDRVYNEKLKQIKNSYDIILIDCPPALGSSVTAAALASDVVIAPVTPEKFCFSGLKITYQELCTIQSTYNSKIDFKIILNKYDSRTTLSHEVLSTLVKHPTYGEYLYRTYIRSSQEFPNVIAKGISIFDSLRLSQAKEDTDLLTQEILGLPSKREQTIQLGSLETQEIT